VGERRDRSGSMEMESLHCFMGTVPLDADAGALRRSLIAIYCKRAPQDAAQTVPRTNATGASSDDATAPAASGRSMSNATALFTPLEPPPAAQPTEAAALTIIALVMTFAFIGLCCALICVAVAVKRCVHTLHDTDGNQAAVERAAPPAELLIEPLHAVRFVGAAMILIHHSKNVGALSVPPNGPGAQWFREWVKFFFLLSGFGPTYSRLMKSGVPAPPSSTREALAACVPSARTVGRRAVSVLPTHLVALTATISVRCLVLQNTPFDAVWFLTELLLVQSYYPVYGLWRYNPPDWYLSVLTFGWLCENASFALCAAVCRAEQRHKGAFVLAFVAVAAWACLNPWLRFRYTWGAQPPEQLNEYSIFSYLHVVSSS
jgi:hypothetical protein